MKIDIAQLEFIDKNLRNMVIWLEKQTGLEFTVTSLYRISDGGVHGTLPLRGIDLRMRNYEIGKEVAELINSHWSYNQAKSSLQCALLHGNGSNLHVHLQVHPNTKKIA